jgi:hypothetical protein
MMAEVMSLRLLGIGLSILDPLFVVFRIRSALSSPVCVFCRVPEFDQVLTKSQSMAKI